MIFEEEDSGLPMTDPNCPDANLSNDPKNCGACKTACKTGMICSQGQCKNECDLPTTKCPSGCTDLKTDPLNCNACGKICPLSDAGLPMGNGNDPEAGITSPEAGTPWDLGMGACTNGTCGVACSNGKTNCGGVCVDTSQMHDYCGDCTTQCAFDEWCTGGKCCKGGEATCGGMCTNVKSDANNCGSCGFKCGGQTPYCIGGTCSNLAYATATLQGGNKQIVFVYAPQGTNLATNSDYANFCKQKFNQNQNAQNTTVYTSAMMYSASAYYCNAYCCYLGTGNSRYTSLSSFQNFGLPLNKALQVFDRGCGDYCGSYNQGLNTTDTLTVTGNTTFTYSPITGNYCQNGKSTTFSKDGVVVCQQL